MAHNIRKAIHKADKDGCHKIPWSYHVGVKDGKISIEKNISVWTKTGPDWKREYFEKIPLKWTAYRFNRQGKQVPIRPHHRNRYVFVDENQIVFNGGFLAVEDPGLIDPLKKINIDITQSAVFESQMRPDCPELDYTATSFIEFLQSFGLIDEIMPKNDQELPADLMDEIADMPIETIAGSLPAETIRRPRFQISDEKRKETEETLKRLMPASRNIHLEIDVADVAAVGFQPLFYFPQADNLPGEPQDLGRLFFGFHKDENSTYHFHWEISKSAPFVTAPTRFAHGDSQMLLTVSQDVNWFSRARQTDDRPPHERYAFFEVFVDGIALHHNQTGYVDLSIPSALSPIKIQTDDSGYIDKIIDHKFGNGPRTFFLGYAPDNPRALKLEPQERLFRGAISRCVFDPNAACPNCPP